MSDDAPANPPPASPTPQSPAPGQPAGSAAVQDRPAPPRLDKLPPFKVLLHNDDHTPMDYVVRTIRELTPLTRPQAHQAMMLAHTSGVSLLLVTHKERAELYREQFTSKRLIVSIEPA